jgi:lysophospholipase L1-like esterase
VIIMAGVNDLSRYLRQVEIERRDWLYSLRARFSRLQAAFSRTATHRIVVSLQAMLAGDDRHTDRRAGSARAAPERIPVAELYDEKRAARRRALLLDQAPDVSRGLEAYAGSIHRTVDLAEERGIALVLMTQATIWRDDLTARERQLLWFGWTEHPRKYYAADVLAGTMRQYNDTLSRVCRERGVACVDLASAVPRDTTAFYDDCHFNEAGCRRVAALVAEHVRNHPQLVAPRSEPATGP